ncbi:MAG: heavy-metal-associated domain-containing protein, partial [Burkholderiaceae bacterium]|nr:heavy-metal-associated domain-containing protein [Burkholderiaceae bacterium]
MNASTSLLPDAPPPTVHDSHDPQERLKELDVSIGGMTCASCVGRVERALRKVPGVQDVSVNLATESARIQFTPPQDGVPDMDAVLRRAVRNAG